MTLGPKFYTKLVSAITRRRKRVRRSYRLESSPIFLQILNLLSKQDVQKSDFSPKRPLRESLMIPFLYITANSFLFYCILVYSILFYFIFVHFILFILLLLYFMFDVLFIYFILINFSTFLIKVINMGVRYFALDQLLSHSLLSSFLIHPRNAFQDELEMR